MNVQNDLEIYKKEVNVMRVTMHCGKRGSLNHNKHDENAKGASWDKTKTKDNVSYNPYGCKDTVEAEAYVYEKLYSEALAKQNAKYIAKRQYKRVRDMNTWKEASQYRACETIWQIGNKDESVDETVFAECINEMMQWKKDKYPNYTGIGIDVHVDETSIHCHERGTWFYHNEDGDVVPGIKGAMREMGVPLPNPNEPESKTNYRKAVIDAECREKWQEICKAHGLEIETEPDREREVGHMGIKPYKAYAKAKEDLDARETSLKAREDDLKAKQEEFDLEKKQWQEKQKNDAKEYLRRRKKFTEEKDKLDKDREAFEKEKEAFDLEKQTYKQTLKDKADEQVRQYVQEKMQEMSLSYRRLEGRPLPKAITEAFEKMQNEFQLTV